MLTGKTLEKPGMLSTHAGLFNYRVNAYVCVGNASLCVPPRELGVDVVNSLVICAICRTGPYQNPPDYSASVWIFILRISSQSVESSLKGCFTDTL